MNGNVIRISANVILDYSCWRCELKGYLQSIKYRIQRKMKEIKKFLKYWKLCRKAGLKYKDIF